MSRTLSAIFHCDWCNIASPKIDYAIEGYAPDEPESWTSIDDDELLCEDCCKTRASAIEAARAERKQHLDELKHGKKPRPPGLCVGCRSMKNQVEPLCFCGFCRSYLATVSFPDHPYR